MRDAHDHGCPVESVDTKPRRLEVIACIAFSAVEFDWLRGAERIELVTPVPGRHAAVDGNAGDGARTKAMEGVLLRPAVVNGSVDYACGRGDVYATAAVASCDRVFDVDVAIIGCQK